MSKVLLALAAVAALPTSAMAAPLLSENFEGATNAFTFVGNVTVASGATYGPCCATTGTPANLANKFAAFGGGNQPSGLIFTPVATKVGQQYTLTFDYGAISNNPLGQIDPLILSVNTTSTAYTSPSTNDLNTLFKKGTYTFIAQSASTQIGFQSNGVNNVDAVLDNVSFTAVPEPATWGMMILGFGAVGGAMRRRRREVLATA